jgi:hypothetical protein
MFTLGIQGVDSARWVVVDPSESLTAKYVQANQVPSVTHSNDLVI